MVAKMPPGTIRLTGLDGKIILHPKPTDDYDDPLNWSTRRKGLHFGIVILYTFVTFLLLDEGPPVAYVDLQTDLSMRDDDNALQRAFTFVGLGLAGIAFIPLAYRYGRRPIYLMSALTQVLASLWMASVRTKYEFFVSSAVAGAAGSVSQTLVSMTVTDMFFVHQFATMNGLFLFAQGAGAFLAPAVAGYIVEYQGWRWVYRWTSILLGLVFLLMLFCLEESTFVPAPPSKLVEPESEDVFDRPVSCGSTAGHVDLVNINRTMAMKVTDIPAPPKTWRQRFALMTRTGRPIKKRFISPFVVVASFPAVTYAAVTYGSVMAWLSIYEVATAVTLFKTPYSFRATHMGLFELSPFIGHTIGSLLVSALSDRWIVHLARKNGGIYHPEMRLWFAIPGAVLTCAGILIYGIGIVKVAPWPVLGLGFGTFGLGFSICLDVALAYITDCYHNMIGDALVGISFIRNGIAIVVLLVIIPGMQNMGMQTTFIVVAVTAAVVLLIPIPMMIWGRRARIATSAKYEHYSLAAIPPASLKNLMEEWS
ncbi:hypothetical protein ED733_005518 [Metarhizium rileyi]|uniref:Major facilitator superfamily (MFS) profile domain-containing protein n=1 Tax=Metarhizium rileyi (strain RCEF 4871) TaxID=1649241 RepID=A0A5C6GD60_METRR|nr:hypothetical protein ED733_005518 [Metarhizium rileyi]